MSNDTDSKTRDAEHIVASTVAAVEKHQLDTKYDQELAALLHELKTTPLSLDAYTARVFALGADYAVALQALRRKQAAETKP